MFSEEIPTLWVPHMGPRIYRSICEYSTDVPEYSARNLWGPKALHDAKFLKNGGWVSENSSNKYPKIEKIEWVGEFSLLGGFFTIPSWDFFLTTLPPAEN